MQRATEEEDSPEPLAQEAGEVGEWLPAWLLEDESKEGLSRLQQQQGPRDVPAADGARPTEPAPPRARRG